MFRLATVRKGLFGLCFMPFLGASPATGALFLNYDADVDNDGNAVWEDTVGTNQTVAGTLNYNLGTGVSRQAATTNTRAGIDFAYAFSGTSTSTAKLAGNIQSNSVGDISNNSASFEIWFKPTDLLGNELLAEYGGSGDGSSFTLSGSTLGFVAKNQTNSSSKTVDITGLTGDFVQAVGVIELGGSPEIRLYVNGAKIGASEAYAGTDWAGTDGNDGIGNKGGSTVGGTGGALGDLSGYVNFVGEVALHRVYDTALSDGEVLSLYESVAVPEPGALGLLASAGLIGLRRRPQKRVAE